MNWSSSSGKIELNITKEQAGIGSHPGNCDLSVEYLCIQVPSIRRQIAKLDPEIVKEELREYGTWTEEQLKDTKQNLRRLIWVACAELNDN